MKPSRPMNLIAAAGSIAILNLVFVPLSNSQERPKPEQILKHEPLEVSVPDFPAEGLILDIGGGGEGVIGQLKGARVVAIDLIKRELEDAPAGPLLKIVMDARDLKFLDNTFPVATVFFTFMYISPPDHSQVFKEISRVLVPGGRLLIWDAIFPKRTDPGQIYILFPLHIRLPEKEIQTGYGVRLVDGEQGLAHYLELAAKAGFKVIKQEPHGDWFFLELMKPE